MFSPSLEGVVVGETSISEVDGAQGRLLYRNTPIEELTDTPQTEVAARLACEAALAAETLAQFEQFMAQQAGLAAADLQLLDALNPTLHPMLMLQSVLPSLDTGANGIPFPLPLQAQGAAHGFALAAKIPALLAYWRRCQLSAVRNHEDFLTPQKNAGSLLWFLQKFPGTRADRFAVKILNTVQVLQMEHGYNASTFAGRVCASTNAPVQSVLSASVGTLYGPLHGGADQAALEMAQSLPGPDAAANFVADCLNRKIKIMGMGHREYKTLDPRAAILKPLAVELCAKEPEMKRTLDTLLAVEVACQQHFATSGKSIHANVEYYKGAVFHALGIPNDFFTALFAMARVFGYLAHYEEFHRHPRLIRPRARTVATINNR